MRKELWHVLQLFLIAAENVLAKFLSRTAVKYDKIE